MHGILYVQSVTAINKPTSFILIHPLFQQAALGRPSMSVTSTPVTSTAETSTAVTLVCPGHFLLVRTSCYLVSPQSVTGLEAEAVCRRAGGAPAVVESEQEMELLKGMYLHSMVQFFYLVFFFIYFKLSNE